MVVHFRRQEVPMIVFRVDDMTCSHCVQTIAKAVRDADSAASVRVDLASHRVEIESAALDAARFRDAITEAGYTPVPA